MHKGFTLIEVLAVVLIIAILTSVALPQYRKSLERSKVAEARQLLPAIYDSCERLATELLCETWSACSDKLLFPKLDIEMKGESLAGGKQWQTKNFKYEILPGTGKIQATRSGGRWLNTEIVYDGSKFTCSSSTDACRVMLNFIQLDNGE